MGPVKSWAVFRQLGLLHTKPIREVTPPSIHESPGVEGPSDTDRPGPLRTFVSEVLNAIAQSRYRLWRLVFIGLCTAVVAIAISVLINPMPTFESVRLASFSSEAVMLDRHGVIIEKLRLDHQRRMLDWIALDDISPVFQRAIIAAEDKRFYWHPGVDPLGAISALTDNLHRSNARGASTITMQLANLLIEPELPKPDRGWLAKLRQTRDALAIELRWSKREILEAYLNKVPFRGELVGVDAAARGLLAKGPDGLDTVEAAALASLVRAPGASRIAIARRACATFKAMYDDTEKSGADIARLCEAAALARGAV